MHRFMIEDDLHAEQHGEYATFDDALSELRRRAELPWDEQPNVAPCTSWMTCGRQYVVTEYDEDRRQIARTEVVEITAAGVKWSEGIDRRKDAMA